MTLVTNAKVTRLLTSASGREVTGVAVQRNGTEEMFAGDIVVSSCGAINSAALLLRSATDRHPNGLANASGVVGRHYMGHVNSVLLAISKTPNPTVFQKTLGVNDFYFGDDEFKYPMGHISFVGKLDAIALSAGAPADRAGHDAGPHGQALPRLLAHVGRSPRSRQSRHARSPRQHRAVVLAEQRRGPQAI